MKENEIEIPKEIVEIVTMASDENLTFIGKCHKLMGMFAGEYIYFAKRNVTKIRNQQIIEEFNRGIPARNIARRFRVSTKRVYEIIKGELWNLIKTYYFLSFDFITNIDTTLTIVPPRRIPERYTWLWSAK